MRDHLKVILAIARLKYCYDYLYFSVPDDFKVNPGAVEAVAVHHRDPDKVVRLSKVKNTFLLLSDHLSRL